MSFDFQPSSKSMGDMIPTPSATIGTNLQVGGGTFNSPSSTPASGGSGIGTGGGGITPISGSGGDKPVIVQFHQANTNVFDLSLIDGGDFDMPFSTANSSVKVGTVTWYVNEIVPSSKTGTLKSLSRSTDNNALLLLATRSSGDSIVKLHGNDFKATNMASLGQVMILGVNWTISGGASGYTNSAGFSIVESGKDAESAIIRLEQSPYTVSTESVDGSSHGNLPPPSMPPGDGNSTNGTNGTSSISPGHSSSTSSNSGLSTGAIVGIAVGVGLAALLAAALGIFFFLRRRRNNAGKAAGGAEQEKLSSLMATAPKDANGNASDPAISPYHDDHAPQQPHVAGAADAHEDDLTSPLDQPVISSASGSRAATPHGVSRHLVEEGMTEAEIRRLEEEEAHLDNEIERVGGGARRK